MLPATKPFREGLWGPEIDNPDGLMTVVIIREPATVAGGLGRWLDQTQ